MGAHAIVDSGIYAAFGCAARHEVEPYKLTIGEYANRKNVQLLAPIHQRRGEPDLRILSNLPMPT